MEHKRPSPFDTSTHDMVEWEKRLSNMCPHFIRFESIRKKYTQEQMFSTTAFILVFFCGAALAFFSTYFPSLLLSFFQNKRQIISRDSSFMSHDTSVILRVKQQQIPHNSDLEKEATAAMNLALDMEAQGKRDKARKLYQHALKLDPLHADILTAYGEFLEKHEHDIVNADHHYRKALFVCPEHSKALINRDRILPVVEQIDQANFNRIDKKLEYFVKVPQNHPGLRRAKKEAYFSHIYHTNAIEGNTLTLAQTRAIIETKLAVGGKSLQEQNEVLGLDSALSYINKTMLNKVGNFSLNDILEIHKRVLGHVEPLEAGRIRDTQVFVGDFIPPSPRDVPAFMEEFIEWLNSEDAIKLHPVEYAAIAHYKLVVIHPFYDGNGRTSRLLMNLILMQAGYPPVSVRVQDRLIYYETLQLANAGDIRPFIRFIADCTERTLDEFLLATHENAGALMAKINESSNLIYSKDEL